MMMMIIIMKLKIHTQISSMQALGQLETRDTQSLISSIQALGELESPDTQTLITSLKRLGHL